MIILAILPRKDGIEEKNPLKQGLKHCVGGIATLTLNIEEKNPLKQGLKHSTT